MSEENNNKNRLIVIFILSIIASVLMIIFTIPKAYAFELVYPESTKTVGGTTYYGYPIPTRLNNGTVSPDNYVDIGLNTFAQTQDHLPIKVGRYKYDTLNTQSFADSTLDNYLATNNISLNIDRFLTKPIKYDYMNAETFNLSFAFHPGVQGEPLEHGRYIDYNKYYSYSFDIIVYSENGGLNNSFTVNGINTGSGTGFLTNNESANSRCLYIGQYYDDGYGNTNFSYTCSNNNGYSITPKYQDEHLQVLSVSLNFNDYLRPRFAGLEDYTGSNSYITPFRSNMLFSPKNLLVNHFPVDSALWKSTEVYISQPYDITMWDTSPDHFCQDTCWTQQDTDNSNDTRVSDSDGFINDMLSLFNSFSQRDYGFSGIINLTFNFLYSLIANVSSASCHDYSIPVFNTYIVLPCGNSFWERDDVLSFKSFYEMFWLGLISYFVAWKIYRDLIDLLTPNTKILKGNEVDSL